MNHNDVTVGRQTDFAAFGRHRFRAPIGIVIDTPFVIVGGWVGVIWPEPSSSLGWRRMLWQRDEGVGRGWLIPESLAYADVVEFGSDPTGAQRWYGVVERYEPGQWLTLQGPFSTPTEAGLAAARLLSQTQHVPQEALVKHGRVQRDRCQARSGRHQR